MAKNSAFNVLYTLLNMLFPLIASMYVSRILRSEGIGKVAYAQNIASYFIVFAILGIQNYGLREISKVRAEQQKKNQLFTQLLCFNAITTTLALVAYIFLIMIAPNMWVERKLYIACGIDIVWNYFNIDWLYQGEEAYGYIVLRSFIIKILSLAAIFLLVKTSADYIVYVWISSVATGGSYLCNVIHSRKIVRLSFKDFKIRVHFKPILLFGVGTLVASLYAKVDITMLGTFATESAVGYYTYGHKMVNLVLTATTAMTGVFLPRLCYLYENDKDGFKNLLEIGIKLLIYLTFPLAAGVFALAPQVIVMFFGEEFLPSSVILRFFTVMIFIRGFGDLLCYQLGICMGQERLRLPAAILASTTNIILNAILIPTLTAVGAAIASIISEVVVNAYQLKKLRKLTEIPFSGRAVFQALVSTGAMTAVIVLPAKYISNVVLAVVVSVLTGVLVYVAMNFIMKNELQSMALESIRNKLDVTEK